MIGVGIALPINYPKIQDQMERIQARAPGALLMATIILAAGVFIHCLRMLGPVIIWNEKCF